MIKRVELSLVVLCGCIPPIKPLFDLLFNGKPISTQASAWSKKSSKTSSTSASGNYSSNLTKSSTKIASISNDQGDSYELNSGGQILVSRQFDVESGSVPPSRSLDGGDSVAVVEYSV